jgi:hypothetical protein
VSWFIISVLYSLMASASSFLAGLAFGFGFFSETPAYIIIFFMFFPFCMAMSMMGFMISTIAPTTKAANASSYAIVLLAIVVESFTADNNILSLLFTTDASLLVQFLKVFLVLYPPFSYTKVVPKLARFSQTLLSTADFTSISNKGPGSKVLSPTQSTSSAPLPLGPSSLAAPSKDTPTSAPWVFSMQTHFSSSS